MAASTDLVLNLTHYSYEDPVSHVVTTADWYGSVYLGTNASVHTLKVNGVYVPAGAYTAATLPDYLRGSRTLTVAATGWLSGDVNHDSHVDVIDLLYVVDAFGSTNGDGNYNPDCDFNSDGSVDVIDLLMLVDNFGL